jgi:hypothetical protein
MTINLTTFARLGRRNPTRTFAGLAAAFVMFMAPLSAQATPVTYGLTIAGGEAECELFRPLGQPCPVLLTGSLTVDGSKTTFDEQFVGFSLRMVDGLTYGLSDLPPGHIYDTLEFNDAGALTAFHFANFIRPGVGTYPFEFYMSLSSGEDVNRYRFGHRADPRQYNGCFDCVHFAVPEPGTNLLLASGLTFAWLFTRRRRKSV